MRATILMAMISGNYPNPIDFGVSMSRVHLRLLIPTTVVLISLAIVGILQAAAKDNATPLEGIIFWLSLAALPFLLIALLGLAGVGIWRAARRSIRHS